MNPSKRKGSAWEKAVADFLGTERRVLRGKNDGGDIISPGWACELKATRELDFSGALNEARAAAGRLGLKKYCAIVKRRGHPVEFGYFVMPLWLAKEVIPDL